MCERIGNEQVKNRVMTACEAALLVEDGMTVGTSGFTMAGDPKAVPEALARRAENGEKIRIQLITGASVSDDLDGVLARAGVVSRRYPYQTNNSMRDSINNGNVAYVDMHLSQVPYWIKNGYLGKIDLAIIEAVAIDAEGNIIPTSSVGASNVLVDCADKVIVEINRAQPMGIVGIHDIYSPRRVPHTEPIPILSAYDRIGTPYIKCSPEKIAAVVFNDEEDHTNAMADPDYNAKLMASHLIAFLEKEMKIGKLPSPLPPLQSGVGVVANAVLNGLKDSNFTDLELYSEVLQDSVLDLMDAGKVRCASGTALTVSPSRRADFLERFDLYKDKVILRPMEISNSPEVIRRLGVIAMNTALEVDLSGNVNSTHVQGSRVMNGIGGSGDFARNAALTIFTTASTAKNGAVSCIVPSVSHVDHTEHDVQVIITEQGVADLRGLTAYERANVLIENCAHPDFRPQLRNFIDRFWQTAPYKHGIPLQFASI